MRLLPLAQKLAEVTDTTIAFHEDRCLHSLDRFSLCQDCYDICPVDAIEPGKPPTLDIDACRYCRACLPVCEMGAYTYTGIDAAHALLDCTSLMEVKVFDLFCQLNPNVDRGDPSVEAAIRVRGCLAGLGVGVYLNLVSQGAERVLVRTDVCDSCIWPGLYPKVQAQVIQAQALLKLWEQDSAITQENQKAADERPLPPVWKAESPPLSRRTIARLAAKGNRSDEDQDAATSRFRERLRILRAVNHLSPTKANPPAVTSSEVLDGLGFALVSVSDACTACSTCANICPTGALTFTKADSKFELTFTPQLCIGCEFCAHVCAPQAITFDHKTSFKDIFCRGTDEIMQQGNLSRCPKCKAAFATKTGSKLCPACDFRHKNPFGSMNPSRAKATNTL